MNVNRTGQALVSIADGGLFELLATAILREANSTYRSLVHPGVNVAGKTVKSPLDGICFVPGANPPHMIAVHHTITARNDLEKKWLHDPSKVKPRKGLLPTAPAGDLIKTVELVREERVRTPTLRVTLVLTTNEEPEEELIRTVEAVGRAHAIEIDLWARSRLCHFLDNHPTGQWIRASFLHVEQQLLSADLLHELSKKSLQAHSPPDDPIAWVPRALDSLLTTGLRRSVTFLVAASGLGKSVACYRRLATHVEGGGYGAILTHQAIASAPILEQAVTAALRQIYPSLATASSSALSFCSPEQPLLLVVEDINRSGQARHLTEKLAGWSHATRKTDAGSSSSWRLICPLWPEVITSLGDEMRKRIEPLVVTTGAFTDSEGRDAVLARARLNGREMSSFSAEAISRALGNDPLLIALHDQTKAPDSSQTIGQFAEGSLQRVSAGTPEHAAADYRQAIRALAAEMLARRRFELSWHDVTGWERVRGEPLHLLARLAHQGELMHFAGSSEDQHLSFRHDRVRDWFLADSAAELDRRGLLGEQVVSEPYFSEVIGAVLALGLPESDLLQRAAHLNPLALFHAFRLSGEPTRAHNKAVLQTINDWLDRPATHDLANRHLRWEALAMLAETDSVTVPAMVRKFRDRTTRGEFARLRNGDLSGGIELCLTIPPGLTAPSRDVQIEHARLRHGKDLIRGLDAALRETTLSVVNRIGALRLAGHFADPKLALAIEMCWNLDSARGDHLAEYVWASAQCCVNDPPRFLGPICDAWAALPDKSEKENWLSPREELAADELRWAFQRWPPQAAMDYFVQRGSRDDLRWPVTCMLRGMDHPKAVLFVVEELAAIQRRLEGTDSFSPFVLSAKDDWRRSQRHGRPMSNESRDVLLRLWRNETNDKHLRSQALSLWAATKDCDDIEVLCSAKPSDELADSILHERLTRGDQRAIPLMIEKLTSDDGFRWWHHGRYVWSQELTNRLDGFLGGRGVRSKRTWGESFESDYHTSEMLMRLPAVDADRLLLKHWDHLRFSPHFVQSALYVSTPRLLEAAGAAVSESPEPAKLFEHLSHHFGLRVEGHAGLTKEAQVRVLAPYLQFLSPMDLGRLWAECNEHGWFAVRRELLDPRLQPPFPRGKWDRDHEVSELDGMLARKQPYWIDHWIDGFLDAGTSWGEILATLTAWLDQRRSLEALEIVAAALEHCGTREDLGALRVYEGMPQTLATQLIADAQFAVRRRGIR